jgi:capsular polysaccharide transport system ATP-binding protein
MIVLEGVTKRYETRHGKRTILNNISLTIERGQKVGILGRNGAGKSTLIRLLSGAELPTSGHIQRDMSVSWPLAFAGAFQGSLTGLDNLRFICRVYNVPIDPILPFVKEFSELGLYLNEPTKSYSAGMNARLAFAISMAIEFDCYLIDEVMAVGDNRFQERCAYELFERRAERAKIIVSHQPETIRAHCEKIFVLNAGAITQFDDVDNAYEYYNSECN